MFDPAALSLISALNIATGAGNAVMLENAGSAGDLAETPQGNGFEALLTLQSAMTSAPAQTPPAAVPDAAKSRVLAIALPATGKRLPDAATPLAAAAAQIGEFASALNEEAVGQENADPARVASLPEFALPDAALIASILAAPERLSRLPVDSQPEARPSFAGGSLATAPVPPGLEKPDLPAVAKPDVAQHEPSAPQPAIAPLVAIAQAAVMEVTQTATPVLPDEPADQAALPITTTGQLATTGTLNNRGPRPIKPAHATATVQGPMADQPRAIPVSGALPASEALAETTDARSQPIAQDIAAPVGHRAAEASPVQDAALATRAEPRAERIDFATLVETLNRAREDAAPNTVRVSVAHAEFGRVSMRFDQDDKGLSVAMSSADPGFARAVTASNDAAQAQTATDTPRGQTAQSNAHASAQGEGGRHQPQGQRNASPERPAAQLRDTLRRADEHGSSDGIFA